MSDLTTHERMFLLEMLQLMERIVPLRNQHGRDVRDSVVQKLSTGDVLEAQIRREMRQ